MIGSEPIATRMYGTLDDRCLAGMTKNFKSIHQFQKQNQYSVLFISEQMLFKLDKVALLSFIQHLNNSKQHNSRLALLNELAVDLLDPPSADEAKERPPGTFVHRASVRYKDPNGLKHREEHYLVDLKKLPQILNSNPRSKTAHSIKIKLEMF